MALRSGLQILQRLRQSEERQQALLLQKINQGVGSLQERINEVEAQLTRWKDQKLWKLAAQVPASELHFDELCRSTLSAHRRFLEATLLAEMAQRDLQMQRLLRARKACETVETLIHHQQDARRLEQLRREQQSVDEMFLLRAAYLAR